jgi:hypothetical protein
MALYVRFMMSLAFGLVGIGLVMKVLLDKLFNEWDAFTDIGRHLEDFWKGRKLVRLDRPEDILAQRTVDLQPTELTTRRIDQRREQLRAWGEVEEKLQIPN